MAVTALPKINVPEMTDLIPFKAVNATTVTNLEVWGNPSTAYFHAIILMMSTHQCED